MWWRLRSPLDSRPYWFKLLEGMFETGILYFKNHYRQDQLAPGPSGWACEGCRHGDQFELLPLLGQKAGHGRNSIRFWCGGVYDLRLVVGLRFKLSEGMFETGILQNHSP